MGSINLINNGSFENGTEWVFFGHDGTSYVTDVHYDGNRSLRCTQVTTGETYHVYQNDVYLVPGKTYHVKFHATFQYERNITVNINCMPMSGGLFPNGKYTIPLEDTVTGMKSYKLTIPNSSDERVGVSFLISTSWLSGSTMTKVWLDALEVFEAEPDTMSIPYRRNEAVAYAKQFAETYSTGFHEFSPTDCANFVSQCLFAGGVPMEDPWHYYTPYAPGTPSYGDAWVKTVQLRNYLISRGYASECSKSQLKKGDIVYTVRNNDISDLPHVVFVSKDVGSDGVVYVCGHTSDQNDVARNPDTPSVYYHVADVLEALPTCERYVGYGDEGDFTTAMSDFGTETYRPGDFNSYIANVQRRLAHLEFYSGAITESLDDGTVQAVEAFKRAKGITPVDGNVGSLTKARLYQPK